MKKVHFATVIAAVVAHFGYLIYLPSGGFMALRWRWTFWLHLPAVCWGIGVVATDLPCPLTMLEQRARKLAGMDRLPETGFVGHYVAGVLVPADRTRVAQSLAFLAAAVSWVMLAVQRSRSGHGPAAGRRTDR
ncbi:DUF2784 domain-containing protein [Mycobacterium sp. CVI_P3]|uniref:DUF2784 domain-containing protein n=1 Tax=Mycobacterium pinniadriaticum TaxID=2994102 RepID=A0ABT3SH89_9MYCO|nr:DUF2784 domain-containing protein [Mycobacterium pinniadriaticum]MCX2932481.1 DUF2784 domain-containing protein [Mycobacterium pinniadriaticum]MCX2938885.1 DUF2784 domain-containing protein [Mycobacterium pinniadriaticum]